MGKIIQKVRTHQVDVARKRLAMLNIEHSIFPLYQNFQQRQNLYQAIEDAKSGVVNLYFQDAEKRNHPKER